MKDFYDLIDIYATMNQIDKNEALHLWYRGRINALDLMQAYLEDEGIVGYENDIIQVLRVITEQARKDQKCIDIWGD